MKDIVWDKIKLREFESLASLTEEEKIVLHDWANGKTVANTSMNRHMCERKVIYIRNGIRRKYDTLEIYTPLLPPRKINR